MLNLTAKSLKYIKQYLLRQQKEIKKDIREVERDDPVVEPVLIESSEPGTDSWLADAHNRTIVLKNQLMKTAQGVKTALLKIKNRTYGKCEGCGGQIEVARLEVIPTATLCLSCSKNPKKK